MSYNLPIHHKMIYEAPMFVDMKADVNEFLNTHYVSKRRDLSSVQNEVSIMTYKVVVDVETIYVRAQIMTSTYVTRVKPEVMEFFDNNDIQYFDPNNMFVLLDIEDITISFPDEETYFMFKMRFL